MDKVAKVDSSNKPENTHTQSKKTKAIHNYIHDANESIKVLRHLAFEKNVDLQSVIEQIRIFAEKLDFANKTIVSSLVEFNNTKINNTTMQKQKISDLVEPHAFDLQTSHPDTAKLLMTLAKELDFIRKTAADAANDM